MYIYRFDLNTTGLSTAILSPARYIILLKKRCHKILCEYVKQEKKFPLNIKKNSSRCKSVKKKKSSKWK